MLPEQHRWSIDAVGAGERLVEAGLVCVMWLGGERWPLARASGEPVPGGLHKLAGSLSGFVPLCGPRNNPGRLSASPEPAFRTTRNRGFHDHG